MDRARALTSKVVPIAFALFVVLMAVGVTLPGFCLFRALFDVDCPGCGITRSILALLSLDLARSLALHPGGIAVVLYFAAYPIMRARWYADRALVTVLAAAWLARVIIPRWL